MLHVSQTAGSFCRCKFQKLLCFREGCLFWARTTRVLSTSTSGHNSAGNGVDYKLQPGLAESYALLNLREGCNSRQLKDAYIRMAKVNHPDSGSDQADSAKFSQLQQAYRSIKTALQSGEMGEQSDVEIEEPEVVFDIKHTAPQHRQYLNFEGIGFGTPMQRQRQYQQHRVAKASENISDLRVQKIAVKYEDALVVKDKQTMKTHKTQNFMDRLVEDLIKESMEKGDFQDLPGTGKPLTELSDRNPFVDSTTHNLNKILINDGFAPEWIALEREIRQEIRQCREALAKERNRLGLPPFSAPAKKIWVHHTKNFGLSIEDINAKIRKYNMVVPFLQKQLVEYNRDKEIREIFDCWEKFLPKTMEEENRTTPSIYSFPSQKNEKIHWVDVWRNIKAMFST